MHRFSLPSSPGILALLLLASSGHAPVGTVVSAFSVSDMLSKSVATTSLAVSTTTRSTSGVAEEDAMYIFHKAQEFAFKDDCGPIQQQHQQQQHQQQQQHYHSLLDEKAEIEESRFWLREMIHLQSGCAAGTLAGRDLCENQADAAEIVARLRRKIETHERRVALRSKSSESIVPTIATELSVGALLVVLAMFWATLDIGQQHEDIPSLQNYQEFMGVLREKGYFVSVMERWFGNNVFSSGV
eukprot:CAMPEP_0201146172 /NCGR_PEP_ID=MMETSP0851-20130426/7854_1 /ASSEMBLY_ACC=CAM_ASM_000631 /TAXON_ID=183588 /ORGANISM="Pseudo-nitzschia fraudulenta, Strain WWA7" /LENGTH=241 /DNA_ID=CAMNT_0047421617 /DNA_START=137 /DNA_END=862 /DNA_ORIENTATION=+